MVDHTSICKSTRMLGETVSPADLEKCAGVLVADDEAAGLNPCIDNSSVDDAISCYAGHPGASEKIAALRGGRPIDLALKDVKNLLNATAALSASHLSVLDEAAIFADRGLRTSILANEQIKSSGDANFVRVHAMATLAHLAKDTVDNDTLKEGLKKVAPAHLKALSEGNKALVTAKLEALKSSKDQVIKTEATRVLGVSIILEDKPPAAGAKPADTAAPAPTAPANAAPPVLPPPSSTDAGWQFGAGAEGSGCKRFNAGSYSSDYDKFAIRPVAVGAGATTSNGVADSGCGAGFIAEGNKEVHKIGSLAIRAGGLFRAAKFTVDDNLAVLNDENKFNLWEFSLMGEGSADYAIHPNFSVFGSLRLGPKIPYAKDESATNSMTAGLPKSVLAKDMPTELMAGGRAGVTFGKEKGARFSVYAAHETSAWQSKPLAIDAGGGASPIPVTNDLEKWRLGLMFYYRF